MEENKTTQKGERAKSLKGSCLWGILLFAVLIFIDQLTKALAAAYLDPTDSIPIVKGWLEIRIVYNRGISYGLGRRREAVGKDRGYRRYGDHDGSPRHSDILK